MSADGPPGHKRENSIFSKLKRTLSIAASTAVETASAAGGDTAGGTEKNAVEQQTEASRQEGTIWDIVRKADEKALNDLLDRDPKKVEARGFVGECPLHMCFLYASPAHLNLAKYIIGRFPGSIAQVYDKPEYQGENVLHISVINKNAEMVEWLLSAEGNLPYRDRLLRAAATGNFFKIGSPCYYGEYPLAFAACTNQWNLVELLIKHGADMDLVDSNGNNVLHLLVIQNLPEIYSKYKKLWIEKQEEKAKANGGADKKDGGPKSEPLWKRLNNDHLTPLTLSAKLGQKDMFSFLLDERKITQWTYGPVSCVLYPLDQLDLGLHTEAAAAAAAGTDERAGALELIVNMAHVKLLMHPRLVDLVNTKWDRFANRVFARRFISTLAYLFIFMITTILGQTRYESQTGEGDDVVKTVEYPTGFLYFLRLCGDFAVLGGALWKGQREATEMMNMGVHKYFSTSGSQLLENILACAYCFCIILVNVLRVLDMPAQSAVLALASIAGWTYMLFFLMAFRLTGPFVVMIHQMLFNDVLRFCIIYAVFLAGFSQAFFVLFDSNGLGGFLGSVKQCFFGMLGDFEVDTYAETTFQYVSVSLLIIYVVVVTILLLNLLIAMMGDTYGNVIEGATELWHLERARIVFAIENEMSTKERNEDANKYWTTVDGERYLQVQEVNADHFREKTKFGAAAAGGDDDKKD